MVDSCEGLLAYTVMFAPGEPPVVVLMGPGVQALLDDQPELSRIIAAIGVRHTKYLARSRHPEVLVLHDESEAEREVDAAYRNALAVVLDVWRESPPGPAADRPVRLKSRGWLARLFGGEGPEPRRTLVALPEAYCQDRFRGEEPDDVALAQALFALERWEQACEVMQRRLAEEPDDEVVHLNLGLALINELQRPEEGIVHLRRAAELRENDPDLWNVVAEHCLRLELAEEGLDAMMREAELTDDVYAWLNVAEQARVMRDFERLTTIARKVVEREGEQPHALLLVALGEQALGNREEAERLVALGKRQLEGGAIPPQLMEHLRGLHEEVAALLREDRGGDAE